MFLRNKNLYFGIFAIATVFLAGILFFGNNSKTPDVKAAAIDNMMGFAWSENIGWISFNSLNCDTNGNETMELGEGTVGCPAIGNTVKPYGVNMDNNGKLSGYAWSENIGWITFNKAVAGIPPGAPYNGGQLFMAKKNGSDEFEGWARAISACQDDLWDGVKCTGSGAGNRAGGWDGWIKLSSVTYGTTLNGTDFEGFAWGDIVVGWVSFNSTNCDPLGAGSSGIGGCPLPVGTPIPAYKVYLGNNRPVVSGLAIDKDYCKNDLNSIKFKWAFDDIEDGSGNQSAYKIDLLRNDAVACSISENNGDLFINAAEINQTIPILNCPGFIDYNHSYTWSVTVWDSGGLPSVTVNSALPAFETPTHQYPRADFSFTPALPLQFQDIDFDPNILSEAFGGFSIDKWIWNFGDLTPFRVINNPLGDTIYFYAEADDYIVDLEVTDNSPELYSCWASDRNNEKLITVESNKPTWNEVEPGS